MQFELCVMECSIPTDLFPHKYAKAVFKDFFALLAPGILLIILTLLSSI